MNKVLRVIILLFLASSVSRATTYYVAKNGSDSNPGTQGSPFLSIQHAANSVSAGDTVIVGDGTYVETVFISRSGTSSARITFKSQNKWGAIIQPTDAQQAALAYLIVDINAGYITWQDFQIIGSGTAPTSSGIKCNGRIACWILGNNIHNIGVSTTACPIGGGAILSDSGQAVIKGNYIYNVSPPRNAPFRCNKQHGIYITGDTGAIGQGGFVQDNIIFEVWSGWGIQFWSFNPNHWTTTNNTIFNSGNANQNTGGPITLGCNMDLGSGEPSGTCDNNVWNNNIFEHTQGGTENNCFENGGTGWGTHNTYDHNLLFDCGTNALIGGQTVTNSVTSDALFLKYTGDQTGDYHLGASSPAIKAGTSNGAPSTDYDGNPQTSPATIGGLLAAAVGSAPTAPTGLTATVQ